MSTRSQSFLFLLLRGIEIWRHKLAMLVVNLGWVLVLSAIAGAIVYVCAVFELMNPTQRSVLQYTAVARAETFFNLGGNRFLTRHIEIPSVVGEKTIDLGRLRPEAAAAILGPEYDRAVAPLNWLAMLVGVGGGVLAAATLIFYYLRFGRSVSQEEHLRGSQLISPADLTAAVKKSATGAGTYTFAGIPVPRGAEMRNFLVTGGMGSGKTEIVKAGVDQAAAAGKKMLIWDKKGEYVQTYFREGIDIIFNPLDARFPGWSPFCETDTTFGFLALAYSLIPAADNDDQKDSFFKEGSRTIFDLVMRQLHAEGRRSLTDLKEVLMGMKPAEIAKYLNHGAGGAVYISPDAAEQAGGVLSTLFGAIKLIEFVPSGSFSLREWARRDDDSRLFITSPDATAHEMLLPITRMFIDIVLRAAMSCELIHHDRLWIFLDECASLGALPTLKHSLTEGRIFGMCHIVGLQNIAQWHAVHDDNVAKTMRSNLQNFLILRVTDEDTQEAYSKLLGAQEIDEQSEGLSYGAASNRDGENLQTSRKEKRIVLPSEIKRLPDCTGYLQLAGAYDVAKVSYTYKPRPIIAAGFILRNELLLANQPAPTAIAAVADPDTGELPGSLYDDDELPIAVEPAPTPKAYTLDDF